MVKRIYADASNMANILGMSYVNTPGYFDPNALEDLGMSQQDPNKPGYEASRTLRLNNIFQGGKDDYDVRSCTKWMGRHS